MIFSFSASTFVVKIAIFGKLETISSNFKETTVLNINSETEFENLIRQIIHQDILTKRSDLILLTNKKAVDIVICKNQPKPTLFFLEIKYHKNNHGRLGFGQGKGGGFQPEILTKRPDFFENNLRWILGSEDSDFFYLLDNNVLAKYLQGGNVGEKFNGIQKKLFKDETGICREDLTNQLLTWVSSN